MVENFGYLLYDGCTIFPLYFPPFLSGLSNSARSLATFFASTLAHFSYIGCGVENQQGRRVLIASKTRVLHQHLSVTDLNGLDTNGLST